MSYVSGFSSQITLRKVQAHHAMSRIACAGIALTALLMGGVSAKEPVKQFGGVPFETIPVPRWQATQGDETVARRLDISVGKSVVIDLPKDAGEIFVADPKIANAIVRTSRKIFIIGTAQGTTSVFVMDKNGAQIASLDIIVSRELAKEVSVMREIISRALPKADIKVSSVGESFILSGTVDSALEVQMALDIANNLVGQSSGAGGASATSGKVVNGLQIRGRDQVMLKVTIAEIQRSVIKQLGINFDGQWNLANAVLGFKTENPFSINGTQASGTFAAGLGNKDSTLRALERQGVLRTLAEPTLTAISGESAKFTAGGEVAVPSGESCQISSSNGANTCSVSVTYRPIGVTLNFTPVVLSEGRISIRVATEVTEIDPTNSVKINSGAALGFKSRKSETTVELPSGSVLATAGLIQQQSRSSISGLPGISNLPILGTLFRSRDYQRFETELVILVQPYIAKPSAPGAIARPDDGFADPTDPSAIFMGRLNRAYGVNGKASLGSSKGGAPVGFIND
jgi:pilus assembly protein CpaC